jgi:hypothetical protein
MAHERLRTTSRASLCAWGESRPRPGCVAPRRAQGQSPPNTGRSRPGDPRRAGLLGRLCGARTLAQRPGTRRGAPAGPRACGRPGGAAPSPRARPLQTRTAATVHHRGRGSWAERQRSGQTPPPRAAERRRWGEVAVPPRRIGALARRAVDRAGRPGTAPRALAAGAGGGGARAAPSPPRAGHAPGLDPGAAAAERAALSRGRWDPRRPSLAAPSGGPRRRAEPPPWAGTAGAPAPWCVAADLQPRPRARRRVHTAARRSGDAARGDAHCAGAGRGAGRARGDPVGRP